MIIEEILMGIEMKLAKEDNVLYTDFNNAYWCIDDIAFLNSNGKSYVRFNFNAYPSREASKMALNTVTPTLDFGGPIGVAYSPLLHTWEATFETEILFPTGIPITEKEQKDRLYVFIKEHLGLTGYTDVIEE